ncbi:unnamed protein product [Rhodiola kirilowii]
MSREESHHDYQDDEEINLYDQNDEVPFPFVDDPEQLIRNRRARDREAVRRNQELPEDRNAAGPVQPHIHSPRPQPQPRYMPRREPAFDDYYGDNYYREPTMGELNAPNFETQPWCIYESPELENITINASVAHSLPKFSGSQGESAATHLQRLHGICQNLKPNRVNMDDFKLKAFYFSLIDSASDWFLSLPSGSIRTWAQMQKKFLDKYYPAGRAMQVRKQLQEIKQGPNKTMYDYLEKFNHLERSCCTLGLPEKLVIEYLIDGLRPLDKMLLDASAGGSMMNLSLSGIRNLIANVAENARFREETTRQDEFSRSTRVAQTEASVNSITEEMKQLKEMMIEIIRRQSVTVKPCEFCGSTDHKTDACPTLIQEEPADVNAVGGYQGYNNVRAGQNKQYGQTSNPGWRNNNSYLQTETQPAIPQLAQSFYQPFHRQYNQTTPPPSQYQQEEPNLYHASSNNSRGPNESLEDIMLQLTSTVQQLNTTMHQNQTETKKELSDLKEHISQLAASVSALSSEPGKLLSQTIQGSQENMNTVTLRSGKTLVDKPVEQMKDRDPRLPGKEQIRPEPLEILDEEETDKDDDIFEEEREVTEEEENTFEEHRPNPVPRTETPKISTTLPFPVPGRVQKQHVMDKEVLELFSKVEINIPLLEAIKQIPRYAKFLKELCTNRRRNAGNDQELMSKNVSAVIQRKVPPKCGDPGTYTNPCTIGNIRIENCMLDLGASINVLPFSIYSCLKIGPLKPTGLTIQLADRSCKQPEGKIEDVMVQVGKLVFPADFYVLKMENGGPTDHAPILLGRPFLKT